MLFLRGVPKIQNFPNFKFFPTRSEGVVIKFPIFPKFKKVQIILGGGELMDFPTFCDTYFRRLPLDKYLRIYLQSIQYLSKCHLKKEVAKVTFPVHPLIFIYFIISNETPLQWLTSQKKDYPKHTKKAGWALIQR